MASLRNVEALEKKKAGGNFSSYGYWTQRPDVRIQATMVSVRPKHRTTKHRRTPELSAAGVPVRGTPLPAA